MTATFDTKAQAVAWATQKEAEILSGAIRLGGEKSVADALRRYATTVSPGKRGARWEHLRIEAFCRDFSALADRRLSEVSAPDFAEWRDARLAVVSAGTVLREINLLSHVFSVARDEWKWISESPLTGMRRPKEPNPRDRRIAPDEEQRLLFALGYDSEREPVTVSSRIGAAFLFAIETAMRAGEITSLTWERVHLAKRYARLDVTKNGHGRDVALSPAAIAIVRQMEPTTRQSNLVFNLTPAQLDSLFRKARASAGVESLHFHDTRHEAITRLARKLDVLDLARMVGIRDLKILMVYYNETATDMAARL